jgi:hypothetical protein
MIARLAGICQNPYPVPQQQWAAWRNTVVAWVAGIFKRGVKDVSDIKTLPFWKAAVQNGRVGRVTMRRFW